MTQDWIVEGWKRMGDSDLLLFMKDLETKTTSFEFLNRLN